jgi:hypothetical protein
MSRNANRPHADEDIRKDTTEVQVDNLELPYTHKDQEIQTDDGALLQPHHVGLRREQLDKLLEYEFNEPNIIFSGEGQATVIGGDGRVWFIHYGEPHPFQDPAEPVDILWPTHRHKPNQREIVLQTQDDIKQVGLFRLEKDHRGIHKLWSKCRTYWHYNKHNEILPYLSDKGTSFESKYIDVCTGVKKLSEDEIWGGVEVVRARRWIKTFSYYPCFGVMDDHEL